MVGTVLQDPERQVLGTKTVNEIAFGLENIGLPREEIIERVEAAMQHLTAVHKYKDTREVRETIRKGMTDGTPLK